MTDPITLPDEDLVPDTTDPEPDESPKTDAVPDDAEASVTVSGDNLTVTETDTEDPD